MATAAYRRLALTPFPAGGEQVIAKNVEHRRHPVAPGDLLPLGVGAAAVRDGQLPDARSEEHTSELQSPDHLVCRLLLEKKKNHNTTIIYTHEYVVLLHTFVDSVSRYFCTL